MKANYLDLKAKTIYHLGQPCICLILESFAIIMAWAVGNMGFNNNNNNNNLLLIRRKYLYEYIQMRLTSYIKIIIK